MSDGIEIAWFKMYLLLCCIWVKFLMRPCRILKMSGHQRTNLALEDFILKAEMGKFKKINSVDRPIITCKICAAKSPCHVGSEESRKG